jgi:hypothetical protein
MGFDGRRDSSVRPAEARAFRKEAATACYVGVVGGRSISLRHCFSGQPPPFDALVPSNVRVTRQAIFPVGTASRTGGSGALRNSDDPTTCRDGGVK